MTAHAAASAARTYVVTCTLEVLPASWCMEELEAVAAYVIARSPAHARRLFLEGSEAAVGVDHRPETCGILPRN